MGYSPWGHKESDRTEAIEHARMHTHRPQFHVPVNDLFRTLPGTF